MSLHEDSFHQWKKIAEMQANVDSPQFKAFSSGKDSVKIIVKTIHPKKEFVMYFLNEEIEDFFNFIELVKNETL